MDHLATAEGFDWDNGNSGKNRRRHDVSDGECEEIFFNSPLLLADDARHSESEERVFAFGVTNTARLLTVVFTMRRNLIRVISARDMNRRERRLYQNHEENA